MDRSSSYTDDFLVADYNTPSILGLNFLRKHSALLDLSGMKLRLANTTVRPLTLPTNIVLGNLMEADVIEPIAIFNDLQFPEDIFPISKNAYA